MCVSALHTYKHIQIYTQIYIVVPIVIYTQNNTHICTRIPIVILCL